MRVTSAIFTFEAPRSGLDGSGTALAQESLPPGEQAESRTFVSLYSGETRIGRIDASDKAQRWTATRPEACFEVTIEIRIDYTGSLGLPDTQN